MNGLPVQAPNKLRTEANAVSRKWERNQVLHTSDPDDSSAGRSPLRISQLSLRRRQMLTSMSSAKFGAPDFCDLSRLPILPATTQARSHIVLL